jgi:hypothetical protein
MGDLNHWARGDRIGPYTVEREAGEGWEGLVLVVRDTRVEHDADALRTLKLYRRTNVLKDVRHTVEHWKKFAGLAQVKALHEWSILTGQRRVSERPYVVFDYVPGTTLYEKVKRGHIRDPVDMSIKLLKMLAPIHARELSVGDADHGRNLIVERGTGRFVVIDMDAGTPNHPPPAIWEDLHEVLRLARKCSGLPLPPILIKVLSEAPDASTALSRLSGFLSVDSA